MSSSKLALSLLSVKNCPTQFFFTYILLYFRYDEVKSFTDALQDSVNRGEDAMSKVYIGYLATRLNKLTDYGTQHWNHKLNVSSDGLLVWKDFSLERRTRLLEILKDLPIRDEVSHLNICCSSLSVYLCTFRG